MIFEMPPNQAPLPQTLPGPSQIACQLLDVVAAAGNMLVPVAPPASSATGWPNSWVSIADVDENEDDHEELAPQTLAAAKGAPRTLSVACSSVDVCHDEKAPPEPGGGLSAAAAGDEDGWVQVGQGSRPGHEPSSLLRKEGERAFPA
jgi:hypothetical protein